MLVDFLHLIIVPLLINVLTIVISEWLIRKTIDKNSDN